MYSEILSLSEYYSYLINKEKIKNRMYKLAAATIDLGDPVQAGKGIAEIIKFLLKRIDPKTRPTAQYKLKQKIWYLNEFQISSKKSPASASLGQSISFVKNILNGHNSAYIRAILKEIVGNL
jgi:hypothetical protein